MERSTLINEEKDEKERSSGTSLTLYNGITTTFRILIYIRISIRRGEDETYIYIYIFDPRRNPVQGFAQLYIDIREYIFNSV